LGIVIIVARSVSVANGSHAFMHVKGKWIGVREASNLVHRCFVLWRTFHSVVLI